MIHIINCIPFFNLGILGDPGADSGGEGKSKRAGKYGTKKSKERREEPLGTISYLTSSKRSPPFFTFLLRAIFSRSFRLFLAPTICPWVSEDGAGTEWLLRENDVRLKESNKRSKERQGPTLGVPFTEVSILCRCPLRESRPYLRTSPRRIKICQFICF